MTGSLADGTPMTTVDPEGPQQGQEVGRLWLYSHPPAPARWTCYECRTVARAHELFAEALALTQAQFDVYATLRILERR
jgi:hypothetical protein